MDYYLGGFFLTQGMFGEGFLCKDVLHPKDFVLSWVKSEVDKQKDYCQKLNITEDEFIEMQIEIDTLFEEKKYGWLSVFLDIDVARKFAKSFLKEIDNLKLIGVATSDEYKQKFLQIHQPKQNEGATGVYLSLKSGQEVPFSGKIIGFDVLEFGFGYFSSKVDSDFKMSCKDELGIIWNNDGFLNSWEDACRLQQYLYTPRVNITYHPWMVFEMDLECNLNV